MQIDIYENTSPSNYLYKNLTKLATVNGIVKTSDSYSEMNPTFVLSVSIPEKANYIKVRGKAYFIQDIEHISNGLTKISCKTDVLESFQSDILNSTLRVTRAGDGNSFITDGQATVYPATSPGIIQFPNKFSKDGTYVLITV